MNASKSARIGLGFGSNIGDRPGNILLALKLLQATGAIALEQLSSLYHTPPWGFLDQEAFANACAIASTDLVPLALLAEIKKVEARMGRKPTRRWGPRRIDIDILFYDDCVITTAALTLPHSELFNRAFVLLPLAEAAPWLQLQNRLISQAAAEIDSNGIVKWKRRSA
jgi:2-amino-4-hydroxy-6-hydroxymethyldihydropteridine diphosphokinase